MFVEGISVDNKTVTSNVFEVTLDISNQDPDAGSDVLGYV